MVLRRGFLLLAIAAFLTACARPAPLFSVANARAHLGMLAGTIGSRAVGTPENARARDYVIDQLKLYGYEVRVQETDARRAELGLTAHVRNVIATRPGRERGALGLLAHYDSAAESPGGADDGIGVAVSLETARVLAARTDPRHTIMVLLTDGEEAGLMGAAALATDREVMDRLQAYVNVEATGSEGAAFLFETGPGNPWIVKPWAAAAPHPRGVSYGIEIYKRLPNDTDFSIFKRQGIPGLNFAIVGDSYAYHTARDTAERVSDATLRLTGENTVATMLALDGRDLAERSNGEATYFDAGQTIAFAWGPRVAWAIAIAALVCGTLAWFRALVLGVRIIGLARWWLDAAWTLVGVAVVTAMLLFCAWALRETRAVYHPWYAHPDRLFAFMVAGGILGGWSAARLGMWIPRRAHGPRHPLLVWTFTLPVWLILAGVGASAAPAAGYLWTLPLLAAAVGLLTLPITHAPVVRTLSVVVLAVSGTLWLHDTVDLLHFTVAVFGRLPIITPVFVYPALMLLCGVMIVPPFVATVAAAGPVIRPSFITAILLVAVVGTGAAAYRAPAYTAENPQRRSARLIIDTATDRGVYELSSHEPGIDVHEGAPSGWLIVHDPPPSPIAFGRLPAPFVLRTTGPSPAPAPATLSGATLTEVPGGLELSMTVTPAQPGLTAIFALPAGLRPARSNLPGVVVGGQWRAAFVAVPPEGVTWRASFPFGQDEQLRLARAAVVSARFPGGTGWQSLPGWLPVDTTVWRLSIAWILPPPAPIAPVPALR